MPSIEDEEFGVVTLRRSARARQVRIRVAPDGRLRASLPLYAPLMLVKRLIKNSRPQLREMLEEHHSEFTFHNGMTIGKSHSLLIRQGTGRISTAKRHGQQIIVSLAEGVAVGDTEVTRKIRDAIIVALRAEAKSYLPKRLAFLAEKYGYSYKKIRFSHASGRWGSCNSEGTISLNIALMKLPFELIDYVLIHELSHTLQMNHSDEFWKLVKKCNPDYLNNRKMLKNENPSI